MASNFNAQNQFNQNPNASYGIQQGAAVQQGAQGAAVQQGAAGQQNNVVPPQGNVQAYPTVNNTFQMMNEQTGETYNVHGEFRHY